MVESMFNGPIKSRHRIACLYRNDSVVCLLFFVIYCGERLVNHLTAKTEDLRSVESYGMIICYNGAY